MTEQSDLADYCCKLSQNGNAPISLEGKRPPLASLQPSRRVVGVALAPAERLEKRSTDAAGSKHGIGDGIARLKDQPP